MEINNYSKSNKIQIRNSRSERIFIGFTYSYLLYLHTKITRIRSTQRKLREYSTSNWVDINLYVCETK